MAEHVWKIGDWCEWGIGRHYVWKLCEFEGGVRLHLINCAGSTAYTITEDTRLEHLPDCTGWTWQPTPKLQLREGAWYERPCGKIVGPCKLLDRDSAIRKWDIQGYWYADDGKHCASDALNLIREVPAPAPKYRPFANAEEFKPHRDRWIADKNNWVVRVTSLSDKGANGSVWESLVKHWTFEDTGLPVGVEVQS